MIKVAIDTGPLYGHRSGVAVATEGMIDALSQTKDINLTPYLVSFRAKPTAGHRRLPLPGIVASHVWSRSSLPNADRWLGEVDVVHGTNYVVPPTRRPAVVTVYDTWFLDHPELATPLVRRASGNLRRAVQRGAVVHTTSQSTATNVARLLGTDRVKVAHLGLPPRLGSPTSEQSRALRRQLEVPDDEVPIVVAIGTEERRKDFPLLVDAIATAGRNGKPFDGIVVIAGAPGNASEAITAAIARLPSHRQRSIRRLGPIDDQTKSALLTTASVLVYPSLDEGFGFPILEAQMMGVPVVARAVGSIPEIGGDGVVLVDERDPEEVGREINAVLTDSDERSRLIEAGFENIKRFSWTTAASELYEIYRYALQR